MQTEEQNQREIDDSTGSSTAAAAAEQQHFLEPVDPFDDEDYDPNGLPIPHPIIEGAAPATLSPWTAMHSNTFYTLFAVLLLNSVWVQTISGLYKVLLPI